MFLYLDKDWLLFVSNLLLLPIYLMLEGVHHNYYWLAHYLYRTNDKDKIVQDEFEITKLPINSSATDIFIDDDNCLIELVPQELEYLTIPNKVGTNAKAILIGDYKVNQPKDGAIQREGVMQTPLLEKNQDKQAF